MPFGPESTGGKQNFTTPFLVITVRLPVLWPDVSSDRPQSRIFPAHYSVPIIVVAMESCDMTLLLTLSEWNYDSPSLLCVL